MHRGWPTAVEGVGRRFLIAGSTVDMLAQGKDMVDFATAAGVQHVVHVGTFHQPGHPVERSVGHMIWHQLVESSIEASGVGCTRQRRLPAGLEPIR